MAFTIGLISPGDMGASVGAAAASNGHRVLWAGDGRSDLTRQRAERGQLEDCNTLENLVTQADIILSVCPPHDAINVADQVIALGFNKLYLEGNAISPPLTRSIESKLTGAGAEVVDGGIVGGPAWDAASNTRLYLSGDRAHDIAKLFADSPLHTRVISDQIGAASALKMTFAAYTKGSTALLAAILAVAEKEGVRESLERQWGEEFALQTQRRVTGSARKAWRFAGEMREIAATFEGAGMPGGFHNAAADVFESLAVFKDTPTPPDIEDYLKTLLDEDDA